MRLTLPPYAMTPEGLAMPPHAKQRAFHALRSQHRMFQGGIGSGKSHAGAREFLRGVLRNAMAMSATGRRSKEGLLYLVGAPTYDMCEVGPWWHLTQWLDEFEIANGYKLDSRRWLSHPRKIKLVTGDTIKFLSLDKPDKWAAATAAGAWIDESELCADPMGAFKMLQGRLRDARAADRFFVVTSSPRGNRGLARWFRERIQVSDPDYGLVVASSRDNPGVAAGYVEQMTATMGERERRQQIEGEIVADDGAVFSLEYSPTASIATRWQWQSDRTGRETYLCYDWGGHFSCLMVDHDPETGTDVVFDELHADGCQTAEFIGLADERLRRLWGIDPKSPTLTAVYADHEPLDARREAYAAYRGKVYTRRVQGNADRESRLATTRWRLKAADGTRKLLFSPELRKTRSIRGILACMENYARVARRIDGDRVILDRVAQDSPYSHASDALCYAMWIRYSSARWHDANRAAA